MGKKVERINMGRIIAAPVLNGANDEYVWTGILKSDKIDNHIIPDDKQRDVFIKKVRMVEQGVLKYRSFSRASNNVLQIKQEESFEYLKHDILELCKEIKSILNNPDSTGMDINLYWIAFCRDYEEIKQKNPNEFKAMDEESRKNLETFREIVNNNEPPIREMYSPSKKQYACIQFLTHGHEKKNQKGKKNNTEGLLDIIERVAEKRDVSASEGTEILKELCGALILADIHVIFESENYANMQQITLLKNYLLKIGFTYEEIESMPIGDLIDEANKTYNDMSFDIHCSLVADTIINGINYVDLEKVLLINSVRSLEAFKIMTLGIHKDDNLDSEMVKSLSEKEKENLELLKSYHVEEWNLYDAIEKIRRTEFIVKKILESGIIDKRTRIKITTGDIERVISLRTVDDLMQNFCDGIYMSDSMQLALIYDAYQKENAMQEHWSDEVVKRIDVSENDMYILSTVNFENLKRFYSLGRMSKYNIKNLVEQAYNGVLDENIESSFGIDEEYKKELIKENTRNLFKNLYNSKIIDEKDIAEYFDEGIISIEQLESLEEEKSLEEVSEMHTMLKQEFNDDRLLLSYKNYVVKYNEFVNFQKEHPEDTERIEQLREELNYLRSEKEKYRELFNKYNHIPESEKVSFGEDLLAKYYVELDVDESDMQESIKLLYEDGFIDLENIINLDKKEQRYLIPMLDSLSIKDTDKIRSNMTFKELTNMVDNIFIDPTFNDERRWIIVMNLFIEDTEQDTKTREEYLKMLDFDNKTERKSKSKGNRSIIDSKPTNSSDKNIYPDAVKWKFYKALDKDARITRYSNGFVEFASSKLDARIIEKYYDGNKQAYGTATFVLPEDKYRKNEGDLITIIPNGLILESTTLKEITPRKDRIAHITKSTDKTWMDQIIKYFDIDFERENDSRYSEEELKELKETVSKYKTKYISEREK